MLLSDVLKGKRIACLGNMNNNFFALSRYLRDRDLQVDLFVPDGLLEQFHPSNDTYGPPPDRIYNVSWGIRPRSVFFDYPQYKKVLSAYDLILGCTYAPAICRLARRPLDIFMPHGTDLFSMPFPPKHLLWQIRFPIRGWLAHLQSEGIRSARLVLINDRAAVYKKAIQKLGVEALWLSTPVLYSHEFTEERIADAAGRLEYYDRFADCRKKYDIVVFSHTRHLWEKKVDSCEIGKGNHIMIKGFAEFCQKAASRPLLILFEYGPDLGKSKNLIRELGIEDNVIWMPAMSRKEIMAGLSLADIGADQFLSGSFGGVGQEILMMGKPLLLFLNTQAGEDGRVNLPPCVNVKSAEDISKALFDYERDSRPYLSVGQLGKQWFSRFRGDGLADAILLLMSGLVAGIDPGDLKAIVYEKMMGSSETGDRDQEREIKV